MESDDHLVVLSLPFLYITSNRFTKLLEIADQ